MPKTHSLTRRQFGLLSAASLSFMLPSTGWAQGEADVAWTSENRFLSGNFLPVIRETEAHDLTVLAGKIPGDLNGVYMRNGPNPEFKPIHFTYPLDGDGMIHALQFEGGKASYRNRFVRTAGLELERRAGRAVYGSVVRPVPIDPSLLLPTDSRNPIKNGACINIMRHGGHVLALGEASTVYEMNEKLETLGVWKAGREQPISMGAHNRVHPRTGDLYALEYSIRAPEVKLHRINPSGLLMETRTVTMPASVMMHDFVLTERNIVLLAGPAVFDFAAAQQTGKPPLQWRPELGMRIAVIPLDGGPVSWIEGDPFFVYHFANGFERGGKIVIDYVHHDRFTLQDHDRATFRRLTIDRSRARFTTEAVSEEQTEFPGINRMREALPTRYTYTPIRTASLQVPNVPGSGFNCLVKHDADTGRASRFDAGNQLLGEAVFIPRPGARGEDDGYLGTFVFDPVREASTFILLDARQVADGPVAVIQMPQRVPQGLHGNWMART